MCVCVYVRARVSENHLLRLYFIIQPLNLLLLICGLNHWHLSKLSTSFYPCHLVSWFVFLLPGDTSQFSSFQKNSYIHRKKNTKTPQNLRHISPTSSSGIWCRKAPCGCGEHRRLVSQVKEGVENEMNTSIHASVSQLPMLQPTWHFCHDVCAKCELTLPPTSFLNPPWCFVSVVRQVTKKAFS